ncbi:MCE family protein [Streptacidiphilus fuscans]|uniref:MCE family protein n=1 Tax=Streptacidiphilus fuscans TaxID=2789292 RepID=A0A931B9C1_9ACTN|nr:MlaD family protein [Streptacidiphilus fuscans]MBF9069270.1 MCE family protein [Streptacidiphilus fuscans]
MLTAATKIKNLAFLAVAVLALGDIGIRYADLGHDVGLSGTYDVHVQLAQTGGLFQDADVTYRGVSVGRVGPITLTPQGVDADLRINDSAPHIPDQLHAVVASLSAVGEQYLDLQPNTSSGPYLHNGSVVPQSVTQTPPPVSTMLTSVNALAQSVPLQSLQTVVDELGKGFSGQGSNLQALLDTSHQFLTAAQRAAPATTQLITDGSSVLATQQAESGAITSFATSADQLAAQLDASDTDLRRLITAVPEADTQITGLLQDLDPQLSVLLANLTTTADVAMTRQNGIQELLVELPPAVAAGSTAITASGAHVGLSLTFFAPLPCTAGYGGTQYRNGLDTGPAPALNTAASCTEPASSGDVRGAAHAPAPAVPAPTVPGELANTATGGSAALLDASAAGPKDLAGLLGMGDLTR